MKIKYIGKSFGITGLTNGKIYDAIEENSLYRVIDDSGEDYLYDKEFPGPVDGSVHGKWEVVSEEVFEPLIFAQKKVKIIDEKGQEYIGIYYQISVVPEENLIEICLKINDNYDMEYFDYNKVKIIEI